MKAAIYARYSTDNQSSDSTADQVALCRRYAASRGFEVVLSIEEPAISGATHERPGLRTLLDSIGLWDCILCTSFSRIGRDVELVARIRRTLDAAGKTAFEATTGLDIYNVGSKVMDVMNEEFRRQVASDTRRGMAGQLDRGLAVGGAPFGYRFERNPDDRGRANARLLIDPEPAAVVPRLFERRAAGVGLRKLADELNREGAPSPKPRGKGKRPGWSMTSVRAVLANPIYRGEVIWSRSRWVKLPDGRRRRLERPEAEWQRRLDESLRLVSDPLWAAVLEVNAARAERAVAIRAGKARTGGRVTGLLSGLIRCEDCGGGMHALSHSSLLGCGRRRDRGPTYCGNALTFSKLEAEARVLRALREQVLDAEVVEFVTRRAVALVEANLAGRGAEGERDRRRLAEVRAEIKGLIRQAAKLGAEDVEEVLAELRAERAALEARVIAAPPAVPRSRIEAAVARWVEDVEGALRSDPIRGREVLLGLLGPERLVARADAERGFRLEGGIYLPVERWIAGGGPGSPRTASEGFPYRGVAGGGFEPPTSGL